MDHVGMGRSDKPVDPDYYTYLGHVERLETFIQELELEQGNLTIFVQDWGSLIGLQVVGTNPDWFDRLVVGNGFLPRFEEGTTPFPLPDNPRITRNLFHRAVLDLPAQQEPIDWEEDAPNLGVESELNYFSLWIDYARNDERFRPEVFVEAHTYYDISDEVEAAYAAPFPTRITMGGVRAFPGLINQMPGVSDSGWAGLGEFDKPFLTIWGNNDGGNLGSPTVQQTLLDHIPGSVGWDHVRLIEASHFLQDDQGEELARRINEFITASPQD
jgi:haloalkane dehalogenase